MSKPFIDLRSDTVTRPSKEMLEYMMAAPTGDDVFGEDPTVIQLQEKLADMFGMEAGMFFPSGTMSNQVAIKAQTQPLEEIICEYNAHIYQYENAGYAFNSGCAINLLHGENGKITPQQVIDAIKPDNYWLPSSTFASIENTCNRAGGTVYSLDEMKALGDACKAHDLVFHLDGARLFNALVAHDLQPIQLKGIFDSISICLSKGLGAPVGSVLVAPEEVITKARKIRKVLGGGMRQAGVLAAACIYALDNNVQKLSEDHRRAKEIETVLNKLSYVKYVIPTETNILIFELEDDLPAATFCAKCDEKGLKAIPIAKNRVRLVTHLDFGDGQLEEATTILQQIS